MLACDDIPRLHSRCGCGIIDHSSALPIISQGTHALQARPQHLLVKKRRHAHKCGKLMLRALSKVTRALLSVTWRLCDLWIDAQWLPGARGFFEISQDAHETAGTDDE